MASALLHPGFTGIRTVFLDRDGVINRKPPEGEYVSTWSQFELLPGVEAAIAALNHSQRKVFVATNQRGVSLGLYTETDVRALHQKLEDHLASRGAHLDGCYFCPHGKVGCRCRKPLPGLFEQAFAAHPGTGPESSVMIGDSLSDIEAGRALGMRTIFIKAPIKADPKAVPENSRTGDAKPGAEQAIALADAAATSLEEAVRIYLPAHS